MPGGTSKESILGIFYMIPIPATKEAIEARNGSDIVWRELRTALGMGWAHQKDDMWWPDDSILALGIESAEKEITELQQYRDFLIQQRESLAKVATETK